MSDLLIYFKDKKDGKRKVRNATTKEKEDMQKVSDGNEMVLILTRLAELDVILPRAVEDLYDGKLTVAPKGRTLDAYNEKKALRTRLGAI